MSKREMDSSIFSQSTNEEATVSIIYKSGKYAVEAVTTIKGTEFRVCKYEGTKSTIIETYSFGGLNKCLLASVVHCMELEEKED